MKLRFTSRALAQFDVILAQIARDSPTGAKKVQRRIQATVALLPHHPMIGRALRTSGLQRIGAGPYPYLIYYRNSTDEVVVLEIRHAARKPIPRLS